MISLLRGSVTAIVRGKGVLACCELRQGGKRKSSPAPRSARFCVRKNGTARGGAPLLQSLVFVTNIARGEDKKNGNSNFGGVDGALKWAQ